MTNITGDVLRAVADWYDRQPGTDVLVSRLRDDATKADVDEKRVEELSRVYSDAWQAWYGETSVWDAIQDASGAKAIRAGIQAVLAALNDQVDVEVVDDEPRQRASNPIESRQLNLEHKLNTGVNVVLLQQVVAAIEQHPEQYNPAFYRDLDVTPVTFDMAGWTAEVVGMPWCEGELAEFCIEGPCGDPIAVDFWAAEALGLDAEQSSNMFRELYEDPHAALDYARTLIMSNMEVWTDV